MMSSNPRFRQPLPNQPPTQKASKLGSFSEFPPLMEKTSSVVEPWSRASSVRSWDETVMMGEMKKWFKMSSWASDLEYMLSPFKAWSTTYGALSPEELRFWVHYFLTPKLEEMKSTPTVKGVLNQARERGHSKDLSKPLDQELLASDIAVFWDSFQNSYYASYSSYFQPKDQYYNFKFRGSLSTVSRLLQELWGAEDALKFGCESTTSHGLFLWLLQCVPLHPDEHEGCQRVFQEKLSGTVNYPYPQTEASIWSLAATWCPSDEFIIKAMELWDAIDGERCKFKMVRQTSGMLGHSDLDFVLEHLKLRYAVLEAWQVRMLLRRTGGEMAPKVLELISKRTHNKKRGELLPELARMHHVGMVPVMMDLAKKTESRECATTWLKNEGVNALDGLIEAVGRSSKRRVQAVELLRECVQEQPGVAAQIKELLSNHKPAAVDLVTESVLEFEVKEMLPWPKEQWPDWTGVLDELWKKVPKPSKYKVGFTFVSEGLPKLVSVDGEREASDELMEKVHLFIRAYCAVDLKTTGDIPALSKGLVEVFHGIRASFKGASLDQWAWAALEYWKVERVGTKSECEELTWMYIASQLFCGEEHLEALVIHASRPRRNLSYDNWQTWIKTAGRALGDNGSPGALNVLSRIVEECNKKTTEKIARKTILELCKKRGWLVDDFEQRAVPTAGLSGAGEISFDFGPRQFVLSFRGAGVLIVKDQDGKVYDRLPPSRKSDDVDKVKVAKAKYKKLKAQLKRFIGPQIQKLNHRMWHEKRWTMSQWREIFWDHPLFRPMALGLVWRVVPLGQEQGVNLLPQEDGSWIDAQYEVHEVADEVSVQICHPAWFDQEEKGLWVEVMGDFEIAQPFVQVGMTLRDLDWVLEQRGGLYDMWHKLDQTQKMLLTQTLGKQGLWHRMWYWGPNLDLLTTCSDTVVMGLFDAEDFWTNHRASGEAPVRYGVLVGHDLPKSYGTKEEREQKLLEGAGVVKIAMVGSLIDQLFELFDQVSQG